MEYNAWLTVIPMFERMTLAGPGEGKKKKGLQKAVCFLSSMWWVKSMTHWFTLQEAAFDALAEMYRRLNETDAYYGLWRRRPAKQVRCTVDVAWSS